MSLSKLRELVMDRKSRRAAVHWVAKSQTQLSYWTELNWIKFYLYIWNYFYMLSSVLFSVYLFMADKILHTLWMLQLIFITFCTFNLNSTFMLLISRQEYWSGLLFPSPGDLSGPGIEPASLTSPVLCRQDPYYQCHLGSPTLALFVVCTQSWPVLCDPMHCRTPGSSVHGIF